jgi:hypothetical protein
MGDQHRTTAGIQNEATPLYSVRNDANSLPGPFKTMNQPQMDTDILIRDLEFRS